MRLVLTVFLVFVFACGTTTSPTTTSTTTTLPASTPSPPASMAESGCPLDADFVDTGRIGRITQPSSDSRTLGLLSVRTGESCERFVFDFDTVENAPATTPPSTEAEFLEGERIIRIHLAVDRSVLTDQLVETRLVDRIYVVRALNGAMFVDFHLAEAAAARLSVSNTPAGMALELSPRLDGTIGPPALTSGRLVLIEPTNESEVATGAMTVNGYSRVFEGNVLVVASREQQVVASGQTTAADWIDTWGEFETVLDLPSGSTDLFVGEESPEDGSLDGVTLKLTVR